MPSLSEYKKFLSHRDNTIGQVHKSNSDMIMEQTWNNDIQSKKCYIYDYYHDDQPWLRDGMTYENTTKTPIDAKFIMTTSQSLDKDRVTVMLQFRPSEKLRFSEGDDLYYYETDYRGKYNCDFPCGLYCDIPDENGVYHKWIICAKQIGNQFTKYLILPANYRFSWIESNGDKRIIRRVWGATRNQNSYNSGLWTAYYATEIENQFKAILPMNPITEKVFYVNDANQNQRLIISAMTENPRVWKVSKCEDMLMGDFGLMRLTFVQEAFNEAIDFVDYNATNPDGSKDVYAMYANYHESSLIPTYDIEFGSPSYGCVLSSSTNTIKAGGSYKTITAKFYDSSGVDVTDNYISALSVDSWSCYIDDVDIKNSGLITLLNQTESNKIKIKFANNMDYLSRVLVIKCSIEDIIGELSLEITNL